MATTEIKTFYPQAWESTSFSGYGNATNPVGKGSSNTAYAYFYGPKNTLAYVYWPFDCSSIPDEATIDSVVCKVKVGRSPSSSAAAVQLYSGSTAKGSATDYSTGPTVYTLNVGTWTRQELDFIRLYQSMKSSGTNSTARQAHFYGADLTVTYTYQSEKFMLKLFGDYKDIARTFKKVSGIWVEQTDLANVIEDGVRYKNGGEYVSPNKTITVTGSGDAIYNDQTYAVASLEINGEQISSAGSYQVEPGTVVDFWAAPFYYYYGTGTITLNGNSVGQSGDQNSVSYQHTVTDNLTVKLSVTGSSISSVGHIDITTGGGSSANLISFTIDGTSYQAEDGMTWGEWVASSYSQSKWQVYDGNKIQDAQTNFGVVARDSSYKDSSIVKTTDTITANYAYVVIY